MPDKQQNQFSVLWAELRSALKLNIDYARLTAAEKLTMLLTMLSFSLLAFVLISLIMFFLSLAVVRCIATGVGMIWAYFIMCGSRIQKAADHKSDCPFRFTSFLQSLTSQL